jgi:Spy/CpxP family protein refolding chaperone
LESRTREELIQLVKKELFDKNEAHKQLEAVKKEAEESAIEQAKEMTTKVEEFKRALLASQHKKMDKQPEV